MFEWFTYMYQTRSAWNGVRFMPLFFLVQGTTGSGAQRQPSSTASDEHSYKVKVINPQKKSEYIVLNWHHMHDKFETPKELKLKLLDSFTDYVPPHIDFHVGYYEGRASAKRWIVCGDDLESMYEAHFPGDTITLWCDAKDNRKRKTDDITTETPPTKREQRESEDKKIFTDLQEKQKDKYSIPQLKLWAKLIRSGAHASYDTPPNIPLITGSSEKPRKTSDLGGVLKDAATAFATALRSKDGSPLNEQTTATRVQQVGLCSGLSPNTRAKLRRSHYQDLSTLKELYENGVLSEEFHEQKQSILKELKIVVPSE